MVETPKGVGERLGGIGRERRCSERVNGTEQYRKQREGRIKIQVMRVSDMGDKERMRDVVAKLSSGKMVLFLGSLAKLLC